MKLSPEQKALLRNCLIQQICAAGSQGLPLATLRLGARMAGFNGIESADLEPHLHFLVEDDKINVHGSAVSAALKRWSITADGVRYAEAEGLA